MTIMIARQTSAGDQARAAADFLRTHPRVVRLTPSQRDRIVKEIRAERRRLRRAG